MYLHSTAGVDYTTQQPNYAFTGILPPTSSWFDAVNYNMLTYGTAGVEMELSPTRYNGLTTLENCLHYFEAARGYCWNDCFMNTYYRAYSISSYCTASPAMRFIYDKTYRYITPNLKGEWRFSEHSGTTVTDSSANINNASIAGAQWKSCGIGGAMSFDGINDYILISDNSSLDINGEITVEAWIKPLYNSTWQTIISRDEYAKRLLITLSRDVHADFGGTIQTTTTSPINLGEWNHVVYTSDGTTSTIYVNGVAELTGTGGADFSSSAAVFIGKTRGNNYFFKGELDEVKVYSRTLTASEVLNNYQIENDHIDLAARWSFGEDLEISGGGTKVYDTSENRNDGNKNGVLISKNGINECLSFDGTDDYISVSDSSSLDINGEITVEAWIKPLYNSTWQTIISRDEYAKRLLITLSRDVHADFGGTIQTTTTSPINLGEWNHVVYTSDGTTSTIYVNGVAELTGTGGADFSSSAAVFIGKTRGNNYFFKGELDEVKVYSKSISAAKVLAEYQKGNGQISKAAEWKFDENIGTLSRDSSENGNSGIINGASWTTGISGNALSFDGSNDYVYINSLTSTSLKSMDELSIETWIKPNDISAAQTIIDKLSIDAGGGIKADFGGNTHITGGCLINTNQWNHVVYTSNGSSSNIFINGEKQNPGTCRLNFNIAGFIGNDFAGTTPFNGKIDETSVYRKVLSDEEILANYQNMLKCCGEWLLNENTGTTAEDSSQNTNTGTIYGAQWADGKVGSALDFDGIDDYVLIQDNSSQNIDGELTVEAWIKPEGLSAHQTIIGRNEYTRRLLLMVGGKIQADFGDTVQTTAASVITANEWNHVVYTSDGTTSTIYVNGNAVLTGNGGADFSSSQNIFIGKTIGGYYPFNGEIDEVRIYARKISDAEVITKFENVLSIRGEWFLDENTGTTAEDSSQYMNTGTIYGAQWTDGKVGSALDFDGIDDYVLIQDNSSLDIDGELTVEAWIKPESLSAHQTIIGRNEYTRRLLLMVGGKIQADFGGTVQTTAASVITANEWNHVVYTSDGTISTIYVNGNAVLIGNGGANFSSSQDIFIGKTIGGYYPFKRVLRNKGKMNIQ